MAINEIPWDNACKIQSIQGGGKGIVTLVTLNDVTSFVDGLDHPEGVAWGPDEHVYAGGEAGQIYRITLSGEVTEIGTTGGFVLGICLDAQANVYACDLNHRAVMRITPAGEVSTYSSGAPGRKMVVPNYPVFDRKGNLYVSDSGGWKEDNGRLFRVAPGGHTEVLGSEVSRFPNGLALSPDGAYPYVVVSNTSSVVRLALRADGSTGPPDTVVELPRTVPDGLAFDRDGNLYIACYTPDVIYAGPRPRPAGRGGGLGEHPDRYSDEHRLCRRRPVDPGGGEPIALAPGQSPATGPRPAASLPDAAVSRGKRS